MSNAAPQRHFGQKVSFFMALFSLFCTLPTFGLFFWLWHTRGLTDTWTPSALAGVAFFLCVAGVCYIMSRPTPPLPPMSDDDLK